MRALSVRQPWAELILRGSKTIECRTRPTFVRERIWIYAAEGRAKRDTLSTITIPDQAALPRGVLVGSVELLACRRLRPSDAAAACMPIDFEGYAWLVTVDGRQPDTSAGMTLVELQRLAKRIGLTDAINLDGGGSTTMVIAGNVVNHPSDPTGARTVSDVLLVMPRRGAPGGAGR